MAHNKENALLHVDGTTLTRTKSEISLLEQGWRSEERPLKYAKIPVVEKQSDQPRARCNFEKRIVGTSDGDRAHGRESYTRITTGKGASLRAEIIAFSWPLFKQRTMAYMQRRRRQRDYCNTPPANWPTSKRISSKRRVPELPLSTPRFYENRMVRK